MMQEHDAPETKRALRAGLHAIVAARDDDALRRALDGVYMPDASYLGSHPIEQRHGVAAIAETVWQPVHRALRGLWRQDQVLIGAHFQGHDWISATGYLHGSFVSPLFDIPPTGNWASLRFGEFHRLDHGRVAASYVIFDVMDLMRQAGVAPWRRGAGVETLMPGPRTGDGVVLQAQDPGESARTLALIEAMMFEGLLQYDGLDSANMHMDRYWSPDMMWYGPGMIGATMGLAEFFRFHQEPWQTAFPLRGPMPTRENKHLARFADGAYACITGWPSIRATHGGIFLGVVPTNRPVDIRVMDWWHRTDALLDENWIFIDMPHLFLQLGVDLFALMRGGQHGGAVAA